MLENKIDINLILKSTFPQELNVNMKYHVHTQSAFSVFFHENTGILGHSSIHKFSINEYCLYYYNKYITVMIIVR